MIIYKMFFFIKDQFIIFKCKNDILISLICALTERKLNHEFLQFYNLYGCVFGNFLSILSEQIDYEVSSIILISPR